jgi:O-antigen/teichoic acid export membrane protein
LDFVSGDRHALSGKIQYYKKISKPAKAGVWFLICTFFQKGIAVLTTPVFTRIFTTSEYGKYSVYCSWQDLISIFITYGLPSAVYARGLVQHEDDRDNYTSTMLSLSVVTTAVSFGVYFVFHKYINSFIGFSTAIVIAMYLATFFGTVIDFWYQKKKVAYDYMPFVLVTLLYTVTRPLGAILAIRLLDGDKVTIRIAAETILTMFLGGTLLVSMLKKGHRYVDKTVWREALVFVVPLIPHYLSQRIMSQSDRIMIQSMVGDSEAGIYSLAYSVGMMLMMLNNALDGTVGPWTFRKLRDKCYLEIRKLSRSLVTFFALCVILFILITPEVITVFASREYLGAIYIVPVISISAFYIYLYNQFIYVEYYVGKTYFVSAATVVCAAINFLLNVICIRRMGYLAAAYTTLICYACYAVGHGFVMTFLCRNTLSVPGIYDWRGMLGKALLVTFAGLAIMKLYPYMWLRFVLAFLTGIVTLLYGVYIIKKFGTKDEIQGGGKS